MGYFSNGTEGAMYEERYCNQCVHQGPIDGPGCSVWLLHLLYNYDECNNDKSMLHILIPRDGIENKPCTMFHAKTEGDS